MGRVKVIARSPAAGYAAALAVPVAITDGVISDNVLLTEPIVRPTIQQTAKSVLDVMRVKNSAQDV